MTCLRECPRCGLEIEEAERMKCPRCGRVLLKQCSECNRCSMFSFSRNENEKS